MAAVEVAARQSIVWKVTKRLCETPMEKSSNASGKMEQSSTATERFLSSDPKRREEVVVVEDAELRSIAWRVTRRL